MNIKEIQNKIIDQVELLAVATAGVSFKKERFREVLEQYGKDYSKAELQKQREEIINELIYLAENVSIGACLKHLYKLKGIDKKLNIERC